MLSLSELGIKKNWTYETIITCFNGDEPHAAPFGFKSPDMKTAQLEMYKGSNTFAFIMDKREFVINFINDTTYFFNSLYGENQLYYSKAKKILAPVIVDCPAYIEAKVTGTVEKRQSYILNAEIIKIRVNRTPRLFNRAESLVIESLITATRINHMPIGDAQKIIKENCRVIKKVAPGSSYIDIMEKLLSKCAIFV